MARPAVVVRTPFPATVDVVPASSPYARPEVPLPGVHGLCRASYCGNVLWLCPSGMFRLPLEFWNPRKMPDARWYSAMYGERNGTVQMLGRAKHAGCFPVALAALPYVKYRRLAGPYLYCLARKLD